MAKKAAPKAAESKGTATAGEKKAKPRTKAEVFTKLAESTGLSKKQITTVFDELAELIRMTWARRARGCSWCPACSS
jgi:pyrroloquinoline quinone (PQQ) biosynthesis protein C